MRAIGNEHAPVRRGARTLAAGVAMALLWSCGGGGGDAPAPGTPASPESPTGGNPAPVGFTPPTTGSFGGGAGKMLYVDVSCKAVHQLDLATRQVTQVAAPDNMTVGDLLRGGVARSANGQFAVFKREDVVTDGSTIEPIVFDAAGRPIAQGRYQHHLGKNLDGPTLSPDGKTLAWLGFETTGAASDQWSYRIYFWDLAGTYSYITTSVEPKDLAKISPPMTLVWEPSGTLLMFDKAGARRYTMAQAVATGDTVTPGELVGSGFPGVPLSASPAGGNGEYWLTINPVPTDSNQLSVWRWNAGDKSLVQMVQRPKTLGQMVPVVSPDNQWLGFTETAPMNIATVWTKPIISAVSKPSTQPLDLGDSDVIVRDARNDAVQPCEGSNVVWY